MNMPIVKWMKRPSQSASCATSHKFHLSISDGRTHHDFGFIMETHVSAESVKCHTVTLLTMLMTTTTATCSIYTMIRSTCYVHRMLPVPLPCHILCIDTDSTNCQLPIACRKIVSAIRNCNSVFSCHIIRYSGRNARACDTCVLYCIGCTLREGLNAIVRLTHTHVKLKSNNK